MSKEHLLMPEGPSSWNLKPTRGFPEILILRFS